MSKYLITGFSGFVAKHFLEYLLQKEPQAQVLGIDIQEPVFSEKFSFKSVNILNYKETEKIFCDFLPDYVLHLASFSSVAKSWEDPLAAFSNNTNIFLNIAEIIRKNHISCRILSVGSSEEYGKVEQKNIPIDETTPLNPISPYAVARVSQEMLSKIYVQSYDLNIILTRSFNHLGTGQKDFFVIPSIIKQFVQGQMQHNTGVLIHIGDTSIVRDFLDVRDVVRAYYGLLHKGRVGENYNICSGNGISIGELIQKIGKVTNIPYTIITDTEKVRPSDNPIIIGNNKKVQNELDWLPKISLDQSLADVYAYMKDRI